MNYSSATGSSVHQMITLIMSAKPLDVIVSQPTTKSMDRMTEQLAQMVAPVKTTAWGSLHGSLALVLDNADYATVTINIVTLLEPLSKPTTINPKINELSSLYTILTLQEEMKTLLKEFKLQKAVTTIGVQRNSMKTTLAMPIKPSNAPSTPPHKMMQGHDERAHQFNRSILSGIGPLNRPHHHLWLSAQQTTEKVPEHQCNHLGRSQNPPLCWSNVQEQLLHQRTNDQVQNAGRRQEDLAPYPTVFQQTFCLMEGIQRQPCSK
jgi:hypothetical protein